MNGSSDLIADSLHAVHGDAEGLAAIWTLPDKATRCFPNTPTGRAKAAQYASERAATADVYFLVGVLARPPQGRSRGRGKDVSAVACLAADIDFGPGHKKPVPATEEEARRLLARVEGPAPSIIIRSGGGLHVYWLLREAWTFAGDADRSRATNFAKRWQERVRAPFKAAGFTVDSTFDLARVLRLPGTLNHKLGTPRPVVLLEPASLNGNLVRYALEDFSLDGGEPTQARTAEPPAPAKPIPRSSVPTDKLVALCTNDPQFDLTWRRDRTDLADPSASSYDLALANAAVAAGWSNDEIAALIFEWRRKHGEDTGKALRPDYLRRTIDKAREGIRGLQRGEAVDTIRSMLGMEPKRVIRRMDDEVSTFFVDVGAEEMLCLGGPETILSGAKLQQRLMSHGRLIRRHRISALEKLGTALLAVAEVEEMPRTSELIEDHVRRIMRVQGAGRLITPDDPQWSFPRRGGDVTVFRATGPVAGDMAASYPRVYISLTAVEEHLRIHHIQATGKSLAAALSQAGWKGLRFQAGGHGRRLWRSPPGFVTAEDIDSETLSKGENAK